jgi:hypothetical protein
VPIPTTNCGRRETCRSLERFIPAVAHGQMGKRAQRSSARRSVLPVRAALSVRRTPSESLPARGGPPWQRLPLRDGGRGDGAVLSGGTVPSTQHASPQLPAAGVGADQRTTSQNYLRKRQTIRVTSPPGDRIGQGHRRDGDLVSTRRISTRRPRGWRHGRPPVGDLRKRGRAMQYGEQKPPTP